jgi:hypothetical protein
MRDSGVIEIEIGSGGWERSLNPSTVRISEFSEKLKQRGLTIGMKV